MKATGSPGGSSPENLYEWLYNTRRIGQRLGLETIRLFLDALGNPELETRFIHVAGTNGKGSVCAMLESVLRACGYRTGFFSSPHLVSVRERFRLDGAPISTAEMETLLQEVFPVVQGMLKRSESGPSYFELTTGMAAHLFARKQCDVCLWETGLGGRLDATSAVTPVLSVITNIALDHSEYLGTTITGIAAEKAGIIKKGIPVLCGETAPDAGAVIRSRAEALFAPYRGAGDLCRVRVLRSSWEGQYLEAEGTVWGDFEFFCPLLGPHQAENLRLVLGVLEELAELGWRINFSSMLEGLSKVEWPGRLHVFQKEPMIVLDGAHNAAASQWLASALRRLSGPTRWSIVFGAMRDKPAAEMMQALSEFAARFYLVPVMGMPDRTFSASELRGQLEGAGYSGEIEECACVDEALSRARARAEGILVAGSLYLVGEALERLGWGVPPDPC